MVCVCAMQSLARQLHSDDVEVRAAAGEAIALLYHSCGISDLNSFLDNDQSDESPPASPISQIQESHFQSSLESSSSAAQEAQPEPASTQPLTTPLGSAVTLGGNADSAVPSASSSPQPVLHQQAWPSREADQESISATSNLQLKHDSPEHAAGDDSRASQSGDGPHDQSSSQAQSASAHHAGQHSHGLSYSPDISHSHAMSHSHHAEHQAPQQQPEALSNGSAAPDSNGTWNQHEGSTTSAQKYNTVAGDISRDQDQGKSKGRQQAPARNPRQRAEAMSDGLEDVVGRMRELATNRGDKTRRSKKDRVSMKSTFRELCNVVEVNCSKHQSACYRDLSASLHMSWRPTGFSVSRTIERMDDIKLCASVYFQ